MAGRHEDSDDESYVRIGSSFEILQTDEDIVKAKEKKQKDQYVLDKQGRRRFHGAFTGGFSAGYYNTVGSKEGWVPSSFVSSRSTKSQSKRQRPEDYMDEDDLDIFGIAPREVSTREPFEQETTTSIKKPVTPRLSIIPGEPPLQDFIIPAHSTIGKVLLKSMGWREGQGVGPKVLRSAQTGDEDGVKVYGCSLPDENVFMFGPHDIAPWQYDSKVNEHGIGYQGMLEQGVLSTTGYSGSVYGMSGQAFGVGALEDEDEDIYSQESITSYNRTMSSDVELNRTQDFGWTGHKSDSWSLEMFGKITTRSHRVKNYSPPIVPKSFVPVHIFTSCPVEQKEGVPVVISANERGHLLSEPLGSVFDLMSSTDRERVKKLAQQAKNLKDINEKSSKHKDTSEKSSKYKDTNEKSSKHKDTSEKSSKYKDTNEKSSKHKDTSEKSSKCKDTSEKSSKCKDTSEKVIPHSPPQRTNDIGDRIISGTYQPYEDNPSKQARYEAYLKGRRKFNDNETRQFTEWEKQKELDEFSRKARLFQPLSQALSDKFRQSSSEETDHVIEENQDATEAAAIGMFGVMTREVLEWHPHCVICKRFNVPDPYPNSDIVGIPLRLKSSPRFNKVMQFELSTTSSMLSTEKAVEQEIPISEKDDLTNELEQPTIEVEEPTIEEVQRPSMSLFVSIFAESQSEDENDISDVTMTTEELPMEVDVSHSDKKWQNLSHISLPLPTVSVQIEPPLPVEPELFGPALPPPTSCNETTKSERHKHKSSHHKKGKHKHSRH